MFIDSIHSIINSVKNVIIQTDMSHSSLPCSMILSPITSLPLSLEHHGPNLWDLALDQRTKGTTQMQQIVHHFTKQTYSGFVCPHCELPINSTWIAHICAACASHHVTLGSTCLSPDSIVNLLCDADDKIFRIKFPPIC